ncbi:MAG: ABC transporter permease subunit [candidate division WOR-3 bacterium]
MLKIFKYEVLNLIQGFTIWVYTLFIFLLTFGFAFFTGDPSKTVSAVLSLVVFLLPIIVMILTIMDYYNSREFIEMLLSYPVSRASVFLGKFLAMFFVLTVSWTIGYLLPIIVRGWTYDYAIWLYISGLIVVWVCIPLALLFGILNDDKVAGVGLVIGVWLLFTLIYDALILIISLSFRNYPVEKMIILLTLLNPIDLARILVVRTMDIAILMGYTGALFETFLRGKVGIILALFSISLWITVPIFLANILFNKKDW